MAPLLGAGADTNNRLKFQSTTTGTRTNQRTSLGFQNLQILVFEHLEMVAFVTRNDVRNPTN